MNKLMVCSIRDVKAEAYLSPFVMRSRGEAVRAFGDACSKGDTPLASHPEDYLLFHIADFDQITGVMTPVDHVVLCQGSDFMNKELNEAE